MLFGRVSSEMDLKFSQGGTAFSNFSVAVDRGLSKDKKAEAQAKGQPTADFIRCKAFGKTAEIIAQYFNKGDQIIIEGRIQTGSYDKDGQKHYTTDVCVDKFNFCVGSKKENNAMSGGGSDEFKYDTNDFAMVEDDDPNSVPF